MLVILSPQWCRLSEATSPKWDYCLRTGGSESPPPHLRAPTLSLLLIKEARGRGFWAQVASPPPPPPRLPRLFSASLLKLFFFEAALCAPGLTSPILRHGKRVFRQTNSGRSPAVGCGCLPAVCAQPGGRVAQGPGGAGAVGPAARAGAPGQGSPTAGGPVSSTVRGCPSVPGKPCKCRSSSPSNTKDPGPAASARRSHRSTLPARRCSCCACSPRSWP